MAWGAAPGRAGACGRRLYPRRLRGLAPVSRQSGKFLGGESRSRRGTHRPKNVFLAAFASLRDPASKALYGRKRAEGKRHNAAFIVSDPRTFAGRLATAPVRMSARGSAIRPWPAGPLAPASFSRPPAPIRPLAAPAHVALLTRSSRPLPELSRRQPRPPCSDLPPPTYALLLPQPTLRKISQPRREDNLSNTD